MLGRVPLIFMYREARLAGVPLKLEFASEPAKERFSLKPKTIEVLNNYLAACKQQTGTLTAIMREQARHQMEWRLARRASGRTPLHQTQSFKQASTFDQNDLHSANLEFEIEIAKFEDWLKVKRAGFKAQSQAPGFDNDHEDEWIEIATWWKTSPAPGPEIMALFDDYVHDSRAWFKLGGDYADSESGMHEKLREWVKRRDSAASLLAQTTPKPGGAGQRYGRAFWQMQAGVPVSSNLTPGQLKAADEYSKMPKARETIPRMITDGREPFEYKVRAGYLRFRKIYGGRDSVLLSSLEDESALESIKPAA